MAASDRPMITVLLATFNGADTLPMTLEAFCRLDSDRLAWRIMAVDNGSTDRTADILRSYEPKLPLTVIHEPKRGKNNALNAGLDRIGPGIVILTDDDVVPAPDWLKAIQATFDSHPEIDVIGGTIEPLWPHPVPPWLLDVIPRALAYTLVLDSMQEGPTTPGYIWGANMAVRASVFRDGHRFNGAVGPDGTRYYAMGSDTEFAQRLAAHGYRLWFSRAAVVRHIIGPHQLTRRWLCARAFVSGRGEIQKYRTAGAEISQPGSLLGIPRWLLRKALRSAAKGAAATLRRDLPSQFGAVWAFGYWCGIAYETRRQRESR